MMFGFSFMGFSARQRIGKKIEHPPFNVKLFQFAFFSSYVSNTQNVNVRPTV